MLVLTYAQNILKNDTFAFIGDKSRVFRRTFRLIKVVPTWKKFEKRCSRILRKYAECILCHTASRTTSSFDFKHLIMYDTQASRCALCVCVCVVSPAPFVSCCFSKARAVLVVVGLCSATSRHVSAGIYLQYAYRISRGRSRASGTTVWGLLDGKRSENVWCY
jgi:hypothetical protein